jgi:hypothetical protein
MTTYAPLAAHWLKPYHRRFTVSTNSECLFFKVEEHDKIVWYYLLQDWDCPHGAWDWREYATAYGPFPSEKEAETHLHNTHPNPGGSTRQRAVIDLDDEPVLRAAVSEATNMRGWTV